MTSFVIGIGSQRAGSTLLHRILEESTPIYMHPIKELHYFDTLFKVRNESVLRKLSINQLGREINHIVSNNDFSFIDRRYKSFLRASFLLSTKNIDSIEYIDLFSPCIQGTSMLGEITPEYMILPKEGIKKMREVVRSDAKIILLARNPVRRFISAFKLLMHGHGSNMLNFEEELLCIIARGGEWMRVQDAFNDYETALTKYRKEFNGVLILGYDQLFNDADKTIEKLADFLSVSLSVDSYKKVVANKVNALGETTSLSEATVTLLETRYEDNQAYLNNIFGDDVCIA